jgi:hypothetical protein
MDLENPCGICCCWNILSVVEDEEEESFIDFLIDMSWTNSGSGYSVDSNDATCSMGMTEDGSTNVLRWAGSHGGKLDSVFSSGRFATES